jgi:glycosyltransferase involved in cell wall biosynthesis/exonuclease VII small subunit
MNDLTSIYQTHKGKVSDKWTIYLNEYDRILNSYRNKKINFLEIGVQNGGSLEIWSKYFFEALNIVGCDINAKCGELEYTDSRVNVVVGDACDKKTQTKILNQINEFDVIIEDGSHTSSDIIKTFALYFKNLKLGGVFVFEDLHCSYWKEYEGGVYDPYSSMNFFKALSDVVNYQHWGLNKTRKEFLAGFEEKYGIVFEGLEEIHSIEFFNSVCVIRKESAELNSLGKRVIAGLKEDVVAGHLEPSFPRTISIPNQSDNYWANMKKSPAEQWEAINQSLKQYKKRIVESDRELEDSRRLLEESDRELEDSRLLLEESDRELEDSRRLLEESDRKLEDSRLQLDAVNSVLNQVYASTSWKVSKPLRLLKNFVINAKLAVQYYRIHGFVNLVNKIKSRGLKKSVTQTLNINSSIYSFQEPRCSKKILDEINAFKVRPLISVVMPVYNVDPKWLELAVVSLKKQWYTNWELCIADDKSTNDETIQYLKSLNDSKIKIIFLDQNVNISGASNAALSLAAGDYVALMDNDDELTSDALYEVVKTINEKGAEFIYSDEDKLEMDGSFSEPHFKPDFAPDMFLSQNYISHLGVIKKELITKVGGWELGLEGAQDYDLYLKVLELTDKIVHISKVLYHWRKIPGSTAAEFSEKSYAQDAGVRALENALKRRKISGSVENGKYPGTYRVQYDIKDEPLVSIIIPFKDKPELLDMSINSVLDKSTYKNYEIIGVSNNSEEKETFEMMSLLEQKDSRVKFIEYNERFNYSAINNYAVNNFAKGEHIVLMNNDIEIITPEWIEELLQFSQRNDVGVVGAKLYYPDDTIQHAGVITGIGGIAGHSHKYFKKEAVGYFGRLHLIQNLSANTAALFMVKKFIFDELKGLNEEKLSIAFNDVDFCLRVQEKKYLNVFTPYCEAYHHESISRGAEDNPEKVKRFNSEVEYMKERHEKILNEGDPFYNVNLTLDREDFSLRERL